MAWECPCGCRCAAGGADILAGPASFRPLNFGRIGSPSWRSRGGAADWVEAGLAGCSGQKESRRLPLLPAHDSLATRQHETPGKECPGYVNVAAHELAAGSH